MVLRLFDTWSRTIRDFQPINPSYVGLYCCGPTVYNYAHIGNLRTYIFEDLLRRTLELNGYTCKHVLNITDVGHLTSDEGEDKMEQGSRRTGKSAWKIAEEFTAAFKEDLRRLNIKEPSIWCKATDHIKEQIEMIQMIERKGFLYRTSDGLYFDTSKLPNYGYLGRISSSGLMAGARVQLGEKRNSTDFALWKFSLGEQRRQMEWDSPWGVGFPGWHIECSAMASRYLGDLFDIHCGGEDHITVHHPNEIAQTEAAHGTRLANYWLHGYFLQVRDSKMSKSSGEFLRLQTAIDCLSAHYRSRLSFSWESLTAASKALDRLKAMIANWPDGGAPNKDAQEKFKNIINEDLNLPNALSYTWELTKGAIPPADRKATLLAFDTVFGLKLNETAAKTTDEFIPPELQSLLQERQRARAEKRWQDADRVRDSLFAAGYEILDTPQGPQLRRKVNS
jgi:cysteinyl-tRNA synthetase